MRIRGLIVLSFLLLAIGCLPPMTVDQVELQERFVVLRSTEAAVEQVIAAALATQAVAGQEIARLTSEPTGMETAPETPQPGAPAVAGAAISGTVAAASTVSMPATGTTTPVPVRMETPTPSVTGVPKSESSPARMATHDVAGPPWLKDTGARGATATDTLLPPLMSASVPEPSSTPTAGSASPPASAPTPAVATVPPEAAPATTTPTKVTIRTPTPTETATPTATATATPTRTPTLTETATRTPAPTMTPSRTPTTTSTVTMSPTPTPTPAALAVVVQESGHVRAGPGVAFDILDTVDEGEELSVLGRNEDQTWWRVCCVGQRPGWVSRTVVRVEGAPQEVPVRPPLMPDDLRASWGVRWECHAEGCTQEVCLGDSRASALRVRSIRWLEVTREATWQDQCGLREEWLTQVDRYSGREQRVLSDPPLFYIWEGADPGPENRTIELLDRTLSLWCTDPRTREVEREDGWSVLYEGRACYDRRSGVLVAMEYTKRWLYSGSVDGQTVERQYFGDYETYWQILADTNIPLSGG